MVIGEVKYTNSESTAKEGLKELLDYICLAKNYKENEYLYNYDINSNNVEIIGFLLMDDITIDQKNNIKGLKLSYSNDLKPLYISEKNIKSDLIF